MNLEKNLKIVNNHESTRKSSDGDKSGIQKNSEIVKNHENRKNLEIVKNREIRKISLHREQHEYTRKSLDREKSGIQKKSRNRKKIVKDLQFRKNPNLKF